MVRKGIAGVVILGVLVCLSGLMAQAQDMPRVTLFGGYSYETLNTNLGGITSIDLLGCLISCTSAIHGYNVSATWNINNHIGLEANIAGHNGSDVPFSEATPTAGGIDQDSDIYTYTFGPRVSQPIGNFEIYTHFLVGVANGHQSNTETGSFCGSSCLTTTGRGTGFGFVTGGGADWYHGHWGIRILEVDYVHGNLDATVTSSTSTTVNTASATINNVRLATGILFRWGMRH